MADGGEVENERVRLNTIINLYDPPKDLNEPSAGGCKLIDKERGHDVLTTSIKTLFDPTNKMGLSAPKWSPVGNNSGVIYDEINGSAPFSSKNFTYTEIIREKHLSGHSSKPSGLYIFQDCGPLNVTIDPMLVITPGSVIDPAGKSKQVTINFFNNPEFNPYLTMDLKYMQKSGFQHCITGNITARIDGDNYIVEIPTNDGVISGIFDRGFKVVNGKPFSDYFKGNPIKNQNICELINKNKALTKEQEQEIMAYILIKELGDTLQVLWVSMMFETPQVFNQSNTAVITNDNVVKYRCMVNGVPVIHTGSGKTMWICYTQQGDEINNAFVRTWLKELVSHNNSVIKIIEAVISQGEDTEWFHSGFSCKPRDYDKGKQVLEKLKNTMIYITNLISEKVNQALTAPVTSDILTTIRKSLSKYHFKTPFLRKGKQGKFKAVSTVNSIIPGLPFNTTKFVPTYMNDYDINKFFDPKFKVEVALPTWGGSINDYSVNNKEQIGGTYSLLMDKIKPMAAAACISSMIASSMHGAKDSMNKLQTAGSQRGGAFQDIDEASFLSIWKSRDVQEILYEVHPVQEDATDELDPIIATLITRIHTNKGMLKFSDGFTKDDQYISPGEIYCIVKDFFPEIFVYANLYLTGLEDTDDIDKMIIKKKDEGGGGGGGGGPAADDAAAGLGANMKILDWYKPIHEIASYFWDNDYKFNDNIKDDEKHKKNLNYCAIRSIYIVDYILKTYPDLNSKKLTNFINLFMPIADFKLFKDIYDHTGSPINIEVAAAEVEAAAAVEVAPTAAALAAAGGESAAAGASVPAATSIGGARIQNDALDYENALDIFPDIYEPYYSILIKSAYSDKKDPVEFISDKLEFIMNFNVFTPREYIKDSNYKQAKILEILTQDIISIPEVAEHMPEANKLIKWIEKQMGPKISQMSIQEIVKAVIMNFEKYNNASDTPVSPVVENFLSKQEEVRAYSGGRRFKNLKYTNKTRRKNKIIRGSRKTRQKNKKIRGIYRIY